jgi:hypothetical protein
MGSLARFALFAGILALVLAAAVAAPTAGASTHASAPAFELAPDHSPCFERGRVCETGAAVAMAHPQALDCGAGASASFAPPRVPSPARRVAPHGPASLSILFRNLRE